MNVQYSMRQQTNSTVYNKYIPLKPEPKPDMNIWLCHLCDFKMNKVLLFFLLRVSQIRVCIFFPELKHYLLSFPLLLIYMIIPLKSFDRYMMCCNAEDLRKTANWTGKGVDSRSLLIERLQCK